MNHTDIAFTRIAYREMADTFFAILKQEGFTDEKARTCAEVFAMNSAEGIYTHGVNRFSRFVAYCKKGYVRKDEVPTRISSMGAMEQWNGNLGPGPLNALTATDRAMEIASSQGLGCVALANTNHWMRGGYYGWQAAKKGFVFIGWTNTIGNMPAWGAVDDKLGNNPLVIAVPFGDDAIVLDTAMSQYSYGALDLYKSKNEKLPIPGGYDSDGNLTQDAGAIMDSRRVLPIGYWKGAGLSLLLDILATILSGGLSTSQISQQDAEHALSQIFIAIDISRLSNYPLIENSIRQIISDYHGSIPVEKGRRVRYPGERVVNIREENMREGIPVSRQVWEEISALLA